MKKYTITVVTTGRADYGLLSPLIKALSNNQHFELQVVATGSHLSHLHGDTVKFIEQDGIKLTAKIAMTTENDTDSAICNAISVGLVGFSNFFENNKTDLLIVLGDRYELWSICTAAVIHKIPIAHIHGGETTFGAIDETIRHSVTKMSALHFAAIELYAKRIIQMGEQPENVFTVGAIGLDNIKNMPLMDCTTLSQHANVNFEKNNIALMTYHPVTLDNYQSAKQQIQIVLNSLLETDLLTLITMPNADAGGNIIYEEIMQYVQSYPNRFKFVKSLGQKGYLSAMKYAKLMIGNSSSGILESASFKLPVVNIGDRQAGRFRPKNVIDCICTQDAILQAIDHALSNEFNNKIKDLINPYGQGDTAKRILDILESIDLSDKTKFLKKAFYDLQIKQNAI